jgi:hypothetical protein
MSEDDYFDDYFGDHFPDGYWPTFGAGAIEPAQPVPLVLTPRIRAFEIVARQRAFAVRPRIRSFKLVAR